MAGNYTHTTRASGSVLTAAIYNGDHENHVTFNTPAGVDDISSSLVNFQTVEDPGENSSESLPSSLQGEIRRLRFTLNEIIGKTYWYETPVTTIEAINASIEAINASIEAINASIAAGSTGKETRNFIINGEMDIWQDKTTFATVNDDARTADMWNIIMARQQYTATISRSTDVPTVEQAGRLLNYSYLITTTTKETAFATTDQLAVMTKLEGYDVLPIVGQIVTLSFWVKNSVPGTYVVWLASGSNNRNYPVTYTIVAANTWEQKTITLTMDDQAAGTWNTTNGLGLGIAWALSMGSNFDGTNATWASSNVRSVSTATNTWMTTTGATFRLTGVELVLGIAANVAEPRPFSETLALCQRYYQKSYDYAASVGSPSTVGQRSLQTVSGLNSYAQISFPVRMRTTPSITVYSTVTGASGAWRNETDGADDTTGLELLDEGETGWYLRDTTTTTAKKYAFHYTADARI